MTPKPYAETFRKWRKMLMHTCLGLAIGILLIEIVMSFFIASGGFIFTTMGKYLIKYLVIPSSINLISVFVGYQILKSKRYSETVKNYVPFFVMCVFCLCISFAHFVFSGIACSFCVPVFMSSIYGSKTMTRRIGITCAVMLIFSLIFAKAFSDPEDFNMLFDCTVPMIMLIFSYIASNVLIQYENEKKKVLEGSLLKQLILQEKLLHDPLTDLYNHGAFYNLLDRCIQESRVKHQSLCLAVIDLDDFKKVNDQFGHEQGDIVLTMLSKMLKDLAIPHGYAARYGGEEFAVIFPDTLLSDAILSMERIRVAFSQYAFKTMNHSHFTFSCGIAQYENHLTVQEFFTAADKAMYQAKNSGKNKIVSCRL